jgi:hypothetical protein
MIYRTGNFAEIDKNDLFEFGCQVLGAPRVT